MPRGKPSMPTDDLALLIQRAGKRHGPMRWFGPQDEAAIRSAAQALGVTFPPSYVAFLKEYGGGNGFCGIKDLDPFLDPCDPGGQYDSVYWETLKLRQYESTSRHLVVVFPQWDDNGVYCLDLSQRNEAGESPVVCLQFDVCVGLTGKVSGTHADFMDFFRSTLWLMGSGLWL